VTRPCPRSPTSSRRRPAAFSSTGAPCRFRFVNDVIGKRATSIATIVEQIAAHYSKVLVAESLDRIKDLGFRFATRPASPSRSTT